MNHSSDNRGLIAFFVGAFVGLVCAAVVISIVHGPAIESRNLDWPAWARAGLLIAFLLVSLVPAAILFGIISVGIVRFWCDRHGPAARHHMRKLLVMTAGMTLVSVLAVLPDPLGTPGEILTRALIGSAIGLALGFGQVGLAGGASPA